LLGFIALLVVVRRIFPNSPFTQERGEAFFPQGTFEMTSMAKQRAASIVK
jgi:hypothetical protein